ncbi:MAG TPA: pre-peptidase C-terminal domain-containing protein [Thermosynechococcaceae cyanobacterium]
MTMPSKTKFVSQPLTQSTSLTSSTISTLTSYSPLEPVSDIRLKVRSRSYVDRVGANNPQDFYRFSTSSTSRVNVRLSAFNADTNISLINGAGRVVASSTQAGLSSERISRTVGPGTYYVRVEAVAGGETGYRLSVSGNKLKVKPASTEGDNSNHVVTTWNEIALKAIQTSNSTPPVASRNLAIVHSAVYDAVNSIVQLGNSYSTNVAAPRGASADAAATEAAYITLVNLYPNQRATFDAALTATLAKIPDGRSERDGIAVGKAVAEAILAQRRNDGASITVSYTPKVGDGFWSPTPGAFAPALLPQWPNVTPFAMTSGSQFRPAPPPAYNSPEYAAELAEVRSLGQNTSTTRTPDQTEIARFWADGAGTYTPPGHWNEITNQVARSQGTSLFEDAQLFATLNFALADAAIAAWDAKYAYNQLRPITAIRQTSDPTWTPLVVTPPFPDHISGHSTFSAAASEVMSRFFGNNFRFSTTTPGLPGVVRSYNSFAQAAAEAGRSRILGGIHVETANQAGLATGRAIGNYVIQRFLG